MKTLESIPSQRNRLFSLLHNASASNFSISCGDHFRSAYQTRRQVIKIEAPCCQLQGRPLFLFFGNSNKTSDFMVDGLLLWWAERKDALSHLKQLVVNMDNGPECSGRRTQFLHRMTEFADSTGLVIRLIYYPPYHSKYNGIERYWASLEKSWNGYLLDSVPTVLSRAGNFVWRGMQTTARLLDALYKKGIKLCGKEKDALEKRLSRSQYLRWWDITICPIMV